jgi:hypothetical protein
MTPQTTNSQKLIARTDGQRWLALMWILGSLTLLVGVIAQDSRSVFGVQGQGVEILGWLVPNIMPTLALVLSVWARDAMVSTKGGTTKRVAKSAFWITLAISVIYLGIVLLFLVLSVLSRDSDDKGYLIKSVEYLRQRNFVLGTFQGIVAATLGIFFTQGA